ncbi:MAG: TatD family hydrolase [Treponema sp.]|jgi:TatD DNase family protein|nr:TatD family hydrolase [Treponema sp.]
MLTDAHAHPRDLLRLDPGAEAERRRLGISCAASAWDGEEFSFHEDLAAAAEKDGAARIFPCFAVHPQLPAREAASAAKSAGEQGAGGSFRESLELLDKLAAAGRIAAVGETGFDFYNRAFRATEKIQDELFAFHLETARRRGLPLVLHVRRAMDKIFTHTRALKALPAVVFHSWPGAPGEGLSLLRRGVNAFFSFGTPLLLNHKNAIRSCAAFPAERLLLETDAPYQPPGGAEFSRWADLPAVLAAAAAIRKEAAVPGAGAEELERITERNFFSVFRRTAPQGGIS